MKTPSKFTLTLYPKRKNIYVVKTKVFFLFINDVEKPNNFIVILYLKKRIEKKIQAIKSKIVVLYTYFLLQNFKNKN